MHVELPGALGVTVTLVGPHVAVRPLGDDTGGAIVTVPEKLLRLVRVIVDVPGEPEVTVMLVGLEEILKSGAGGAGETLTVTVLELVSVLLPLVAVTVTK